MSKKIRVGFDLDETITPAPELMSILINALKKDGHEIHIITYRHPLFHKEETINELRDYGIEYDYLHLTGQKDEVCDLWRIDMALDDRADYHYPDRVKFWIGFVLPKVKLDKKGSGLNFLNTERAKKQFYACDVETDTTKKVEPYAMTEEEIEELKKHDDELE